MAVRMKKYSVLIGACLLTTVSNVFAWGHVAHAVIAARAQAQLTAQAQRELAPLLDALGAASLADIASWADERRTRAEARWHFVNMPKNDCHFRPERDCANGQCLVEAVKEQVALLSDRNSDAAHRANALIYVVHLAGGDSSQPLHAGSREDKGANTYQIRVGNRGTNLHSFWDSGLVFALMHTNRTETAIERLGADLERAAPRHRPEPPLDPAAWIEQSCSVWQQEGFYPPTIVPESYTDWARPILEHQLILGADELAAVLNRALLGVNPYATHP